MKFLKDETVEYMDQVWGFSHTDQLDDMALFWSRGYHELVALRLVSAGAVEGNCKEARNIISVAKSIGPRKEGQLIDACLKEEPYELVVCKDCNAHHYLGEEYGIVSRSFVRCPSCAGGKVVSEKEYYSEVK